MSREHRERVWQNKQLKGGKLLVMLALAEHAGTDGECYPGTALLMEKTRLTDRQLRRVLNSLDADKLIKIEERAIGRGKRAHYILYPDDKKADFSSVQNEKAEIVSAFKADKMSESDEKADISDNKSGHFEHKKADILDTDYSPARSESITESKAEEQEEEDTHVHDPVSLAWWHAYNGNIPENLETQLRNLAKETSIAATIHGIKTSAKKDSRNFRYIAECARNYVPSVNGYHIKAYRASIPGIVAMPPVNGQALPPVDSGDPWASAMAELSSVLPGSAPRWLEGSRLEQNGELAGEPLYRVVLTHPQANAQWLSQQAEPAVRKKLASILRKRILVEFIREVDLVQEPSHDHAPT